MEEIEAKVQRLKETYQSSNPFDLCDALGIFVLHYRLPQQVRGFFTAVSNVRLIYLNDGLEEQEGRIVCGHELGHAILHEHMNSLAIASRTDLLCSRYEAEADYFCACLLLEDAFFDIRCFGLSTLEQIAGYTGLDVRQVERRAQRLGYKPAQRPLG